MSLGTQPMEQLSVCEQPAKLHRFRYLKEIKAGRRGSILHGRSSVKTPVRVKVCVGECPAVADCLLKLIGCTVFEDLSPHPFYLFGDDCTDGAFQKELIIPAGSMECEVSLDRIVIVCTPKKKSGPKSKAATDVKEETAKEDTDNYHWRFTSLNVFKKPPRFNPFQGRDINKLKIAFQLFAKAPDSEQWLPVNCSPVATETVSDAKIFSQITVECVIPNSVSSLEQDIWLYTKDPLPAESAQRFRVSVEISKTGTFLTELPVKSVKKHLVVFNFADMGFIKGEQSIAVSVVDKHTGDCSEPVNLKINFPTDEPARKRQRGEKTSDADADFLDDILKFQSATDYQFEPQTQGIMLTQDSNIYFSMTAEELADVPVVHMVTG